MRFSQHKGSLHGLESQIDTDSDGENRFLFHGNGKRTERGKDARMFAVCTLTSDPTQHFS